MQLLDDRSWLVGLHGVLAFVVVRRTKEIGIRMALGAGRRGVIRMVMSEMAAVIGGGLVCGVTAGAACGRFVESQLFGVKSSDPEVLAACAAILLVAALLAAHVPARRASRIDPRRALRWE